MKIPFVSFEKMHDEIKDELTGKFQQVLAKNWFIQGEVFAIYKPSYGLSNKTSAVSLPLSR